MENYVVQKFKYVTKMGGTRYYIFKIIYLKFLIVIFVIQFLKIYSYTL